MNSLLYGALIVKLDSYSFIDAFKLLEAWSLGEQQFRLRSRLNLLYWIYLFHRFKIWLLVYIFHYDLFLYFFGLSLLSISGNRWCCSCCLLVLTRSQLTYMYSLCLELFHWLNIDFNWLTDYCVFVQFAFATAHS